MGSNRRPIDPNPLRSKEKKPARESGEASRGLAWPTRPQNVLPPPQNKSPQTYSHLGEEKKEDRKERKATHNMERHRHREIEDLVHQGIEELSQNGGFLPAGDPPVQDVRGDPKEEKAKAEG